MEGHTIILAKQISPISSASPVTSSSIIPLAPGSASITTLETRSIHPRNSGNGGIDANGISGIVIGVIGLFIAAAGLIKGRKFWQECTQRRVNREDVESQLAHLENNNPSSIGTPNNTGTINYNVWNIHVSSPQIESPAPAVLPAQNTFGAGETEQMFRDTLPNRLRCLSPPERSPTWPPHRRLKWTGAKLIDSGNVGNGLNAVP